MAVSPTDRNESLQCVACALRQAEGKDITERDLTNALLDWDERTLEASVVNAIGITGEMENEIKSWNKRWSSMEGNSSKQTKQREYDNWIKSSVLVANKLGNSSYIDNSGYKFNDSSAIQILSKPNEMPTPEIFLKPKIPVKLSYLPPPPILPILKSIVLTSKIDPV